MAHITCITSGLRGLLNASFELANRLQRAGHRVTYACPHDVRESVEAQGLEYVQLPAVNFNPAPPPANTDGSLGARLDEWRSAPARREAGIKAMNLQPFCEFVEAAKPDLVLIDVELYEHIFTLYGMRLPFALITPFFATGSSAGMPPLSLGVVPGEDDRGSGLTVWKHRLRRFKQIKMVSLRNAFTERRSVLKSLARKVGYPLSRLEEYGPHVLFADKHLPVLHLTASELEFGLASCSNVHYVGPMVARGRVDQAVSTADRTRLGALYAARQADGGALLYCWLTTMNNQDTDFLARVIAAVGNRADWTLIIGYSGSKPARELPRNVHVFEYVPQIEVLAQADLCITYGGMNTVHECLAERTPMLTYPRFHDQPGVAARLVHHGLAHRGDVGTDSAEVIAGRIQNVLDDDALRAKLQQMHATLQRYEHDSIAANVVASLLS
ncbi:MAG: glycosyltransferase [Gammaproteobacteria bacterium]